MVKFAVLISVIAIIGVVFTAWGLMVDDYEANYINSSNLITNATPISAEFRSEAFANRTAELNESFSGTQKAIKSIAEEESGWKQLFTGGLVVIPLAFIESIKAIFTFIAITVDQIGTATTLANVPLALASIGVFLLFMFMMLKIVNAVRKHDA